MYILRSKLSGNEIERFILPTVIYGCLREEILSYLFLGFLTRISTLEKSRKLILRLDEI